MNTQNNNILSEIQEKIKQGKIKMRPKMFFVLRGLGLVLLGFVLFGFVVYAVSFTIFSLKATGVWFLPGFGFLGLKILLGSLPWVLIFVSLVLILALEIFAERFALVYRRPIVTSLLAVVVIVILTGFAVSAFPVHPGVLRQARDGKIAPIENFYGNFSRQGVNNIYHGIVIEIKKPGFDMQTPGGRMFEVVPQKGFLPLDLQEGRGVLVIGERMGDIIRYNDIRMLNEGMEMFPFYKKRHKLPDFLEMK